jgi:hypothetical protein
VVHIRVNGVDVDVDGACRKLPHSGATSFQGHKQRVRELSSPLFQQLRIITPSLLFAMSTPSGARRQSTMPLKRYPFLRPSLIHVANGFHKAKRKDQHLGEPETKKRHRPRGLKSEADNRVYAAHYRIAHALPGPPPPRQLDFHFYADYKNDNKLPPDSKITFSPPRLLCQRLPVMHKHRMESGAARATQVIFWLHRSAQDYRLS